jgi:hypothetical protein
MEQTGLELRNIQLPTGSPEGNEKRRIKEKLRKNKCTVRRTVRFVEKGTTKTCCAAQMLR